MRLLNVRLLTTFDELGNFIDESRGLILKKMRTQEYTELNYDEKRELLRLNGSFLGERSEDRRGRKTIYALYGFFVEIEYNNRNQERCIRVVENYFDTDTQLEGIFINLN